MSRLAPAVITVAALAIAALALPAIAGDLPDPIATPGALNPLVTEATIAATICKARWAATQRPPEAYTSGLKRKQLKAGPYASGLAMTAFEEDHLISLEIGGHPMDARNLWPQHWAAPLGAHQKDELENALRRMVCAGKLPLASAQAEIASNWIQAYHLYVKP
jgi:hypothetical protein